MAASATSSVIWVSWRLRRMISRSTWAWAIGSRLSVTLPPDLVELAQDLGGPLLVRLAGDPLRPRLALDAVLGAVRVPDHPHVGLRRRPFHQPSAGAAGHGVRPFVSCWKCLPHAPTHASPCGLMRKIGPPFFWFAGWAEQPG